MRLKLGEEIVKTIFEERNMKWAYAQRQDERMVTRKCGEIISQY
jgi:hypothetical protein